MFIFTPSAHLESLQIIKNLKDILKLKSKFVTEGEIIHIIENPTVFSYIFTPSRDKVRYHAMIRNKGGIRPITVTRDRNNLPLEIEPTASQLWRYDDKTCCACVEERQFFSTVAKKRIGVAAEW